MRVTLVLASMALVIVSSRYIKEERDPEADAQVVRMLELDAYPMYLDLNNGKEKAAFDAAFVAFAKRQISFTEFLRQLETAAPAAHRIIVDVASNLANRIDSLEDNGSRDFIQEFKDDLMDMAMTWAQHKEGEINVIERNQRLIGSLTAAYLQLRMRSVETRREIFGVFPDVTGFVARAFPRINPSFFIPELSLLQ